MLISSRELGLEAALESTLRGTTGIRTLYWNNNGTLERTEETRPAVAGDTVVLTLDSTLQATAQQIIEEQIALLRAQPDGDELRGQDVR
ncbi:MAG: hypothetical protein J6S73_06900, partial [Lentisphaeria bacterium]|nr:hypothetical protein [Lentisphaeria bacterium]